MQVDTSWDTDRTSGVAITWLLQACISYRLDEYNQVEKMSAPNEQEKLHSQTTQLRRVRLRSMTAGIEVFQANFYSIQSTTVKTKIQTVPNSVS